MHLARILTVLGLVTAVPAAHALSQERQPPERLDRLEITIGNSGAAPIACSAVLAHWRSRALGTIAPGTRVGLELWSDRATGTVYLGEAPAALAAVESLWCGIAGRSWSTRHAVPLARRAGVPAPAVRLDCRETGGRLVCTGS